MDDSWGVSQGEIDGQPAFVRVNKGAASMAGDPAYGVRIGVAIALATPNQYGLPGTEEMERLAEFEDAMLAVVDKRAVLTVVITTAGVREFVFYAGEADWLPKLHLDLRGLLPTYEVQVVADADADWQLYRAFAG